MPIPVVHSHPIKRPNFILSAAWIGGDDNLLFRVTFPDSLGVVQAIEFQTRNVGAGRSGEICLPIAIVNNNDLNDLGPRARDIMVAHTRMACMVAGHATPGSIEFANAFLQPLGSKDLQTAIGTAKIVAITHIDDVKFNLTWRVGNGPDFTQEVDYTELGLYQFVPDTQLLVIPGAVKKTHAAAYHDYPNTVLTQAQKDAIVASVLATHHWI